MDRYNLTARVFPMMLLYLPVLFIAILFSIEIDKKIHMLTSLGVVAALSYFNSQVGRKYGKQKQDKLWDCWGGAPAVQLLRWRNQQIDANSKKRYHFKLQSLCPAEPFPTKEIEAADNVKADVAYQSWVRYLISQTRDTKKFNLLFKENINYGFWRNLWGLKPAAITLNVCIMVGLYFYWVVSTKDFNPIHFPRIFFIGEPVMFALTLIWVFIISSDSVKIPAFGYGERLLESVDHINKG